MSNLISKQPLALDEVSRRKQQEAKFVISLASKNPSLNSGVS
jgi:hypothetical protein